MAKYLLNYRYWVLAILGIAGFANLVAVPSDILSDARWLRTVIITKTVAAACLWAFIRLESRWVKERTIRDLINEVMQSPNPMK